MRAHRPSRILFLLGVLAAAGVSGQELADEQIPNWPAPSTWSPPRAHGLTTQGDISSPLPFIAVTPCRQYDSRNATALPDNSNRSVTLTGAPCNIPTIAAAVSVNITVFSITGAGGNGVFQVGTANDPTFAWINYPPTETQRGNAGAVPLNVSGQIVVKVNQGGGSLHFTVDVNGYYAGAGTGSGNTFLGEGAGNFTMTGNQNTGIGFQSMTKDGVGSFNTAVGTGTLANNLGGGGNTAVGDYALNLNASGNANTAVGDVALGNNQTGSNNIAIGIDAGVSVTSGSYNILIGNNGFSSESNRIRIGDSSNQFQTYIAGIYGGTISGDPVVVSSIGQLGRSASSRRFKEEIRDIAEESDGLMELRPVAFRYRREVDPGGLRQYGLIAEEVAEVYPDLVSYGRDGRPESVRTHFINALLLNEVQKQHRTIDELKARLAALEARLPAEPKR